MWYFPPLPRGYTTAAAKLTATLGVADIWVSSWLWSVAGENAAKVKWAAIHHHGSRYTLARMRRTHLIVDVLSVHVETSVMRLASAIPESDPAELLALFWAWVQSRRTGLSLPPIDSFEHTNGVTVVLPPP